MENFSPPFNNSAPIIHVEVSTSCNHKQQMKNEKNLPAKFHTSHLQSHLLALCKICRNSPSKPTQVQYLKCQNSSKSSLEYYFT